LLKSKKDCADVYRVTLIEVQAHRDAFIQRNTGSSSLDKGLKLSTRQEHQTRLNA